MPKQGTPLLVANLQVRLASLVFKIYHRAPLDSAGVNLRLYSNISETCYLTVAFEMKQALIRETAISRDSSTSGSEALPVKNHWLSLPIELTTTIFLDCHAMDSTMHDWCAGVKDCRSPPLPIEFVLSNICRLWRGLALDLPALWKRFIYIPSEFNLSTFPPRELSIYEERSGGKLEDIYLSFVKAYSRKEFAEFTDDIYRRHSQSLRRFALIGKGPFDVSSHLRDLFPYASAPNLEYFAVLADLQSDVTDDDIEDIEPTLFMHGAPRLTYLRCDGVVAGCGFPPTANLSTLQIEDNSDYHCVMTLNVLHSLLSLPLLENLSLFIPYLMQEWPTINDPNFPITMQRLKNLRLCNEEAEFECLLPLLKAPLLEYVTLKKFDQDALEGLQRLRSSVYHFPNVHDLILIESKTSTASQCSAYASLFPSVRSLTVWGDTGSVHIFKAWTSLQRATVNKVFKPGVVEQPKRQATSTNLTLRVPLKLLPTWREANAQQWSILIEPLGDREPVLPPRWPQNDLESQGFRVKVWDEFYGVGQ